MRPRLENPYFQPSKSHILAALDNFVDMLKIRYSSPLFRLRTASDIEVHRFFAQEFDVIFTFLVFAVMLATNIFPQGKSTDVAFWKCLFYYQMKHINIWHHDSYILAT
jgi:hypothetical protein